MLLSLIDLMWTVWVTYMHVYACFLVCIDGCFALFFLGKKRYGMTSKKRRNTIKPVDNKLVNVPPDSDDEDAKKDLLFRRRLFLKRPDQ